MKKGGVYGVAMNALFNKEFLKYLDIRYIIVDCVYVY